MEEADKNSLIQQRIKKMIQNKKKNLVREEGDHVKRLKSGAGDKYTENQGDQEVAKPQSSIRMRRPVSAFKATESSHGVSTASNQKIEIDIRGLLTTVFEHGTKLQQYLKEKRLDLSKYYEWLSNNQLFILSTLQKLKEVPEDKYSGVVQKEAIQKISREIVVRDQVRKCQEVETKISKILEERLRTLSKYSV